MEGLQRRFDRGRRSIIGEGLEGKDDSGVGGKQWRA